MILLLYSYYEYLIILFKLTNILKICQKIVNNRL